MTTRAIPPENNKVWQLERYARLTSDGTAKDDANKWEVNTSNLPNELI